MWPASVVSNGDLVTFPSRAGLGTFQKSFLDTDASLHIASQFPRPESSTTGEGFGRSAPDTPPGALVGSGTAQKPAKATARDES